MRTFLWVILVVAALNTLAVMIGAFSPDGIPPAKPLHRLIDAVITAGLGAWALWLLAGG